MGKASYRQEVIKPPIRQGSKPKPSLEQLDPAEMLCTLFDADGETWWKDDKWRERRGCFAAGTLVHTEDGPMPIEQVKLGTQVKTMRSVREEAEDRPRSLVKSALRSGLAVAASLASFFVPATGSAELENQPAVNESFAEEQQIAALTFSANDDPEHIYAIELLRPRSWFVAQGIQGPGDRCRLQIDELQAEGWASVTKLEAGAGAGGSGQTIMRRSHLAGTSLGVLGERVRRDLHEEEARKARDSLCQELDEVRTGGRGAKGWVERAKHPTEAQVSVARHFDETVLEEAQELGNDVYEVSFDGVEQALRVTGLHPLYSVDGDAWVSVRDLQVGERLQTAEGAVTVEALERVRGIHRVFNLEVETDHEYFVDWFGVRAHNSGGCAPTLPPKNIADDGEVKIEHYYRSNDHEPAHMHVVGGGPKTSIGPNGKPLAGDPELTVKQQSAVDANRPRVRSAGRKIGRWLRWNEENG